MADKFTISEVYKNESNRVQADESNPIKDDTLMLVSENNDGTYKTKALDYGTLQSSLCASLDIQNIINNSTTVNNYGDTLGISGDYPCFFEMYSSYHFNSLGTADGLYGKIWSGEKLQTRLGADGTLYNRIQFGSGVESIVEATKSFLSNFTCLSPIEISKDEHPDPQLVTVMMSSKQSGGVYFDHMLITPDGKTAWQRMPIFTYNPNTNSDYIATYKFIVAPGSRYGIFGKTGFFNAETNVVLSLTNTKGHLVKNDFTMKFSGRSWTTQVVFKDIEQPTGGLTPYEPGIYRLFGPIAGTANGGTVCLMMRTNSSQKWSTIATKQFYKGDGVYVDFGRFYIPNGSMFTCWTSNPKLKTTGTSNIDGKSYINGTLYFERIGEDNLVIQRPLKLVINPNRTPLGAASDISRNVQFRRYAGDVWTKQYTMVTETGVGIYSMQYGTDNFRYFLPYNGNEKAVVSSEIQMSVDCVNLLTNQPLEFYDPKPIKNGVDEFTGSSSDGYYSGIKAIDGTNSMCNFTNLANTFAYNCTNLETAKFNNNLKTIGVDSFSGCTALKTVSMPGVQTIGKQSFSGCTALTSFNVDNSGYSTIPSNCIISADAFNKVAISNLVISQTNKSNLVNNSFNNMKLTNCKIDYAAYTSNESIANTNITNLSISLGAAHSRSNIPLVDTTCRVDNLSVVSTKKNNTFMSKLSSYHVQNVYIKDCASLAENALSGQTSLKNLVLENANVPTRFCKECISLVNASGNLHTIGDYAFQGCKGLKTLRIGNTTEIGDYAFNNCSSMTTLSFPSTLTSIGKYAFAGCSQLVGDVDGKVNLSNVTSIGNNRAFAETAIKQVLFGPQFSGSLDTYTFQKCMNLKKLYFRHEASDDTKRTLYKILVGSANNTKISEKTTKTSNICSGTKQTIEVYYNCTGFADTQYRFATITGNEILFEVEIPK